MTLLGVRLGVWLAAAALSAGGFALALGLGAGDVEGGAARERAAERPSAGRPERAAAVASGRGTRVRVGGRALDEDATGRDAFERPVVNALAGSVSASAVAAAPAAVREPGTSPSEVAAAKRAALRPALRPPEVVSLERDVVRSLPGLPREDTEALEAAVDAEVADLAPEPGEAPDEFEARREDARARAASDQLLLRARLKELYAQQVYPYGFPAEQLVVPMERQLIQSLPPEDRAAALRQLVDAGLPGPPQPRFEAPESGLVYRGGPGL